MQAFQSSAAIVPFTYREGVQLRTVLDDKGDPWFCAADIAAALGVARFDRQLRVLSDDERHLRADQISTSGHVREMLFVSESGLYRLVMRSDKSEARPFQDWVTREVLPSIRKTGAYIAPTAKPLSALDMAESILASLREQERQVGVLALQQAAVVKEVAEVQVRTREIEARVTASEMQSDYFTVAALCRLIGLPCPSDMANALGRECSRLCKLEGIEIGHVPDSRWGTVNSYPRRVIELALKRRDGLDA